MTARAAASLAEIVAVLRSGAHEIEPHEIAAGSDAVDALDHHLQCAAGLAALRPDDLELQVAGLVHDVGHDVSPEGREREHGITGAAFVRPVLGERVARLVELHVPAKRYLVAVDPGYRATLSAGSIRTLEMQGDALSPAEQAELEADPHLADALELRRADEAAKEAGRVVPPLDAWLPALEAVAAAQTHQV